MWVRKVLARETADRFRVELHEHRKERSVRPEVAARAEDDRMPVPYEAAL